MIGLGTIVNACAIIAGGTTGLFLKDGLPQRYKDTIMQALGLSIMIVGISGTLQGLYRIIEGGKLDRQYVNIMILSLVIGGVIGEFLNIEAKLESVGNWIQSKLAGRFGNFTQGFVTASLVYCVGAMAILGSLEDGLAGNPGTLFAKSILDGVISIIFSATMGIGVIFSAVPVFVYQGSITLLAGFIEPFLTDTVISQTSLVGSVLILGIGFNVMEIRKVKVGNLLPSVFIPVIYYLISGLFR